MQQTRRPWCGVIMILALAGCADDAGIGEDESAAPDGVRVYCVGDGQQWATWDPGYGQWLVSDADNLETCIGLSNVWGPDEAPFTFDEWDYPPGFPTYHDQIVALCENKCWTMNQDIPDEMGGWTENTYGECSAAGWTTHSVAVNWTPEAGYNCQTMYADQGTVDDPYADTINWGTSTPLTLPLSCSLLDDCHAEFDPCRAIA